MIEIVIASPDAFLDFVNLFNNIAIVGFIRRDDLICLLIGIKRSNDVPFVVWRNHKKNDVGGCEIK